MTSTPRLRTALVATGALVLLVPAAADAATRAPVTGGTTTLRPGGGAYRVLSRAGVRIQTLGAATAKGSAVSLPVTGGAVGPVTVLDHASTDGLFLTGRGGDARLSDLHVRLGKSASRITGRIDGAAAQTLFVLRISRLDVDAPRLSATRTTVAWRLSARAARTLRGKLGVTGLRAGVLGLSTFTARLAAPPAPAAPVPAPAPGAPTVSPTVLSGTADWGVRASFRNYITGFAAGRIVASDGATVNADGTYRYAAATGSIDRVTGATDVAFRGTVAFEGHGTGDAAQLRLWVRNPHVVAAAGASTGTLYADVSSKSLSSGAVVDYPGVGLATLDLTRGTRTSTDVTLTWTGVPAKLTAAGVDAFAGFYAEGSDLDPLSFTVATR